MKLRYKCLVLDHDDTTVDSTPHIHYPAHLEALKELRPEHNAPSLNEWILKNYNPGLHSYMTDDLGFSEEEGKRAYNIWREYSKERTADFFPGFVDGLRQFIELGGIVAVVSHSVEDTIRRDYAVLNDSSLMPELVFGWSGDPTKCKPQKWPMEQILQHYNLQPDDCVMVDDNKPGLLMAKRCSVDSVFVSYAHDVEEVHRDLIDFADYHIDSVESLFKHVIED